MKAKPTLLLTALIFCALTSFGQTIVCETSSCTANDYTLDYFYLGDENGIPFSSNYCEPGTVVDAYIWTNFSTNSAAGRYSLYMHYNLYVNDVFINTMDECRFDGQAIPTDGILEIYHFPWECGSEVVLRNFYMSWQPNASKDCDCQDAKCYKEEEIPVYTPLIANFNFETNCQSTYALQFFPVVTGGSPAYIYFWDFGDGTTGTEVSPIHSYTSAGPFTVTLLVQDTMLSDSYSVQTIALQANVAPQIIAPPNINIEGCSPSDIPDLPYSETPISITENQFSLAGGSLTVYNSIVSLNYVDTRTNTCPLSVTRTFTITDSCNNTKSATQTLTINDTTPPTASNPTTIYVQCITDVPAPNINDVTDEVDNCGLPTVYFDADISDGNSCPETIKRTYIIEDACGNSIYVTQDIIIKDDILPTASNLPTVSVTCLEDIPLPDVSIITDEADNCGIPMVAFVYDSQSGNTCSESLLRTYSVTDNCGNFINVTQTFVVNDDIAPTASNPANINVTCIEDVPNPDVNVIIDEADNCSVPTVSFISDVPDNTGCPFTITRTYQVTDACNNSILRTQTITINDNIAPTATAPPPITVHCIDEVPSPDVSIITDEADNCSTPEVAFVSDESNHTSCPEIITRTYSVTDNCGNVLLLTQNITIRDDVPPTASKPSPIVVKCVSEVPEPDISVISDATDNCSIPVVSFVSDSAASLCPQMISRTYRLEDDCGNYTDIVQDIYIDDDVYPTASNPATLNLTCGDPIPPPDPSVVTDATDNCSVPTVNFISETTNNQSCPEIITRFYRVSDACGNSIEVYQDIIIRDDIYPTASNPDDTYIASLSKLPPVDVGVVIDEADNCGIPTVAFVNETIDNSDVCSPVIIRTYSVSDACKNSINVTHKITVLPDNEAPIASNPPTLTFYCMNEVPKPDSSVVTDASDNMTNPTVTFVSESYNNIECAETLSRIYRVSDACGNTTDVIQNIIIEDTIAPYLASKHEPELTVYCENEPIIPSVEFIDNCSSTVDINYYENVVNIDSENYDIIRTWDATDACANQSNFTQTVHVKTSNEVTVENIVLCVIDEPINLESYINDNGNGNWLKDGRYLSKGTLLDPSNMPKGVYEFTYTNKNGNCSTTKKISVEVNDNCVSYPCIKSSENVHISKMITPNNDGINDYFEVKYDLNNDSNAPCFIRVHVQLFNRWGTKIYESLDYNNDWSGDAPSGSVGSYQKLPTGTYYYIVELENSGLKPIQNYLHLGTYNQ